MLNMAQICNRKYYLISEQDDEKIAIPDGETVIGRGPFLRVRDKRVSRSHAIISLKDESMQIKPNHDNPTFFCNGTMQELSPLKRGEWKNLCNGDSISLLPDSLIFVVSEEQKTPNINTEREPEIGENDVHEDTNLNTTENYPMANEKLDARIEKREEQISKTEKQIIESTLEDSIDSVDFETKNEEESKEKTQPERNDIQESEKPVCNEDTGRKESTEESDCFTKENGSEKIRVLPSWMTSTKSLSKKSQSSKKCKVQNKGRQNEKPNVDTQEDVSSPRKSKNVPKIKHTDELSVKTERERMHSPVATTSTAPGKEETSTGAMEMKDDGGEVEDNTTRLSPDTSSGKQSYESREKKEKDESKKKLPKCVYGKSCYRRNPVHLEEYSHSDHDSDNNNDDKPECPYGTSCYRKNLQHKSEYKHTQPPAKRRRTRKSTRSTKRKSVLTGESDDDGENTYDYDDSFIDDDTDFESESSYNDDDEEDPDFEAAEDEDLDELVDEAEQFKANEKMQKS